MVTSGIDGSKDNADKPPDNSPKPGEGGKGKAKGKKVKRRWMQVELPAFVVLHCGVESGIRPAHRQV